MSSRIASRVACDGCEYLCPGYTIVSDGIAATALLPGPASTQLAIYCAWRLRGAAGALIGGLCFIAGASYNPETYRQTPLEVLLPVTPDEIDPRARIVPPSLQAPTTTGWQSFSLPGVPKLPGSNSLSSPWHQFA